MKRFIILFLVVLGRFSGRGAGSFLEKIYNKYCTIEVFNKYCTSSVGMDINSWSEKPTLSNMNKWVKIEAKHPKSLGGAIIGLCDADGSPCLILGCSLHIPLTKMKNIYLEQLYTSKTNEGTWIVYFRKKGVQMGLGMKNILEVRHWKTFTPEIVLSSGLYF